MPLPLVAPLLALAAGILASHWVPFPPLGLAIGISLLIALAFLANKRSRMAAKAGCLAALLLGGALIDVLNRPGAAPHIDASSRETVLLTGCVVQPPAFYEGRDQFTVELAPRSRARVTLTIRDGETPPDLRYGQKVEFEARVRPLRNFQNPGAFDYQGFAARSHIYWTASIASGGSVTVAPGRCGSRFYSAIFAIRTAALNQIDRLYAGNPYATGIMEATLIGEPAKLEKIWTDHFRRTGTYHMLVIDGLHITVLAGFLLFLLRLCFVPEIAALALTATGAWLYAVVSGFNAPAVRAAAGFTFYLACRFLYRRGRLLNLLAAVAIVYLIFDPGQLFDAGFQLSFLSVAAIAAFAVPVLDATSTECSRALKGIADVARDPALPPEAAQFRIELRLLAETLRCYSRIPFAWLLHGLSLAARLLFFAYEMAVISTAIQIGLALPMAVYFHRIPLSGFSANVFAVPLLALVVPIGFVAIFTGWHFPAYLAERLLAAGQYVADWHLRWEPDWRMADPPLWLALAFSTALVAFALAVKGSRARRWATGLPVITLFILLYWDPFPPHIHPGQLELTTIDVGQGDALLVAFPDRKLMLVDGGGILAFGHHAKPKIDIGEDVVSPYLWTRAIRKIDVVVLTHAHDDHAAGLPALIENFRPRELWTGATPASDAWSDVRDKALAGHLQIIPLHSGQSFDFGGARVEILSPPPDYQPAPRPKNDDSLALRITYGRRSFLLTGDMEKQMELRALTADMPLHADVLKVGHHGSNTSSTDLFLDAVAPTFAVISDGFENSFHHPHPLVLQRLEAHRATALRTDLQGLITVRTDGDRIWIETYRPSARH